MGYRLRGLQCQRLGVGLPAARSRAFARLPLGRRRPGWPGPEAETLHVLPSAWFRNTWSWDTDAESLSFGEATVHPCASIIRTWGSRGDLAFHCVTLAHVDPAFAKYQLLLLLVCREWFQAPNAPI